MLFAILCMLFLSILIQVISNVLLKFLFRYSVDLNELQILVGRVKDNWKFAHVKGTSALHVLDRFSISLQVNTPHQVQ